MVIPYLVFNGNCKEVLDFYERVFESDIGTPMLYGDYVPEGVDTLPEDLSTWILHAEMQICGTNFWFADEVKGLENGNNVRLSIIVPTKREALNIFQRLKQDGDIILPPTETFYSTFHAVLTDKFGVIWNMVAEEAPNLE